MGNSSSRGYRAVATEHQAQVVDDFNVVAGKVADKLQEKLPNTTDRDIKTQAKLSELTFRMFMSLEKQTEKRGEDSFHTLLQLGQETVLEKKLVEGLAAYLIETYRDDMSAEKVIKTQDIAENLRLFMDGFKKSESLNLPDLSLLTLFNLSTRSQVALSVLGRIGIGSFSDLLTADQDFPEANSSVSGGHAQGNHGQQLEGATGTSING